jgi:hypothetical protein
MIRTAVFATALLLPLTAEAEDSAVERVTRLKAGKQDEVSYTLFQFGAKGERCDLFLSLRNVGAKWIELDHISSKNFSVKDAKGNSVEFALKETPRSVGYGEMAIAHILILTTDAPSPWSISFDSGEHGIVRVKIHIADVTLRADPK